MTIVVMRNDDDDCDDGVEDGDDGDDDSDTQHISIFITIIIIITATLVSGHPLERDQNIRQRSADS